MTLARTETLAPPNNQAVERAVLCAMMCYSEGLRTTLTWLKGNAEVFYLPRHQHIFRAIVALYDQGLSPEALVVIAHLNKAGKLEQSGGGDYVLGLIQAVNGAGHAETHCKVLLEAYAKRRVAEVGILLQSKAYAPSNDPFDVMREAQMILNQLTSAFQVKRPLLVGELYDVTMDHIKWATQQPGGLTGVPTGLEEPQPRPPAGHGPHFLL